MTWVIFIFFFHAEDILKQFCVVKLELTKGHNVDFFSMNNVSHLDAARRLIGNDTKRKITQIHGFNKN